MEDQIREGQRTAASMAIDHAVGAINASAQEAGMMAVQFNRLPVAAVENMVGLTTTGSPLSSVLADASRGAPERLGQELINSIALGRNPIETARLAVRRGLGPTFTRMRTIARTEQLRVYRQVSLATYSHSGVVDEYRRLSARDSRVCPACLFADGRTYPISKPFAEHPQGRCTTIPVIRGHKAPEFETGEQWFKKQNVETQKKILGNTRYDLWKGGKVKQLGDFIEETHDDDWGDSMTTRSLHDVLGHRPVRPDRAPTVYDEAMSEVYGAATGGGPPEMYEAEAEGWAAGSEIEGDFWVVKSSASVGKVRSQGFGGIVMMDADPAAVEKKLKAAPGSEAIKVKINVQKPAVVQINPMSSSKDIAEKFFGRPLAKLQEETGETDVYKIFQAKGYDSLDLAPSSGKGRMIIVFDPANTVPVKPGGPKPPPAPPKPKKKTWEPIMSEADAKDWAEGTVVERDLYYVSGPYHRSGFSALDGFDTKEGPFEHRFGDGVYLIADDDKTLSHYQNLAGSQAKTIVTKVKLKKVAVVDDEGWTMTDEEILRLSLKVKPKEARELLKTHGSAHNVLRNLDYDAIEFKSTRLKATGGNRIIVFDKHNVVAIDGKAGPGKPTPPEPPKPPPLPPKTPPTGPIQNGTFVPKGYRIISDGEEGDATLRAEYKPWLDSLSKEEKHALGVYYGAGAGRINTTLRLGIPFTEPSDEKNVKLIDQALNRSKVPENLVVFRGMRNPRLAKAIQEGRAMDVVFFEDGYTSTTTSKKIAREKFTGPGDDTLIAEIRLPKGTKGGLISPDYSEENEILLPRGMGYKVVGHHIEDGKKVVTLEIVRFGDVEDDEAAWQAEQKALEDKQKKERLATPKSLLTPKYRTAEYGFYVDDEEIIQTTTTKEVEKVLKKRYPSTEFDFKGMHLEVAQTTADEYHRLAQKYPEVAGELRYIGTYQTESKIPPFSQKFSKKDDAIAHASRDGRRIGTNIAFYGDPEKFKKSSRNCGYTGWTVQYDQEVYTTLTHEFGHQVANYYENSLRTVVGDYYVTARGRASDIEGAPGTTTHLFNTFNSWYKPTEKLSRYAVTTNGDKRRPEGWAEAFSKSEVYPDGDWDEYTKAYRKFVTELPPDNAKWKGFKDATEMSSAPEKEQVKIRGKLQELYKKVGVMFTG